MLRLKKMHSIIIAVLVLIISILIIGLWYISFTTAEQENDKEVSELIKHFENILMLKVPTETTKDTPFEYYNDVDNYPFAKKASAEVMYNADINGTSGEVRLKYTQRIYNDENQEIHSAVKCTAIWIIEKKNNVWEVIKFAELDYCYGMSSDEYNEAIEILHKMENKTIGWRYSPQVAHSGAYSLFGSFSCKY